MAASGPAPLRVLYFASIRERAGIAAEEVRPPASVVRVADLIAWIETRGGDPAAALRETPLLRCAVNQEHVGLAAAITAGDEVAFFPPVTGG